MNKDFQYFLSTLKDSIKTWEYFVNWEKVFTNRRTYEIVLNKLNYLLGKENLQEEFVRLYQDNPDIVKALPILLAVRDKKLEIFSTQEQQTDFFDFSNGHISAENAYRFLTKSGLDELFKRDGIKNLVDYVTGVEVGLDSNGRKNRGGKLMEELVAALIKKFADERGFLYLTQANAGKIKRAWGRDVYFDKSSRSFDVAIFNPESGNLKLVETNFYNGGGSKLKSVCGEFRTLHSELKTQGIDLIWVTDGMGWKNTTRPLEETYNYNDYVFNLRLLEDGVLDKISW